MPTELAPNALDRAPTLAGPPGFYWIASYPKSGNTWTRAVLSQLMREAAEEVPLNDIGLSIVSSRPPFDEALGIDSHDLTDAEVRALLPLALREEARRADGPLFRKVHDAFDTLPDGSPVFPPDATLGALYVVRNPLDVCVSLAHHLGHTDLDVTVGRMNDPSQTLGALSGPQLRQPLGSWSGHVTSWLAAPTRVHVMRYEDMLADPHRAFGEAAAFAGLDVSPDRVAHAVARCAFERMQREEAEHGFKERPPLMGSFFRSGRTGGWRDVLTDAQRARLVTHHRVVMHHLGYLDDDDQPLF